MALGSSDQDGAKKCQIQKVLHFYIKNSNKIRKKIGMVVMMLGYHLPGLWAFPNMVINANIMRKSGKKERYNADSC